MLNIRISEMSKVTLKESIRKMGTGLMQDIKHQLHETDR